MSGAIGATGETTLPVGQSIVPTTVPNIPPSRVELGGRAGITKVNWNCRNWRFRMSRRKAREREVS